MSSIMGQGCEACPTFIFFDQDDMMNELMLSLSLAAAAAAAASKHSILVICLAVTTYENMPNK
jgi:hypothetical protein